MYKRRIFRYLLPILLRVIYPTTMNKFNIKIIFKTFNFKSFNISVQKIQIKIRITHHFEHEIATLTCVCFCDVE